MLSADSFSNTYSNNILTKSQEVIDFISFSVVLFPMGIKLVNYYQN